MTKTSTAMTTKFVSVDPRIRMKEIRAQVVSYQKNNPKGLAHLGELPNNMEDAVRVVIATQDLLETEKEKHRKATMHICELVHTLSHMSEVQYELMSMVEGLEEKMNALNGYVRYREDEVQSLDKRGKQYLAERDAVLTTMKLLNGQQLQPAHQETSMSKVMGHSNRDQG